MKDYQDVVKNRFDVEEVNEDSIYGPNQPVGKYILKYLEEGLNDFLNFFSNARKLTKQTTLLDLGCGNGGMITSFLNKGISASKITGIDFSNTRISNAKTLYPDVSFKCDDALEFKLDNQKFDIITSFDLFSHFKTKEQIIKGLKNVHKHLENDGLFLWYDISSKDHFSAPPDSESWGFNKQQMVELSKEAGFEVVFYKPLFKLFFNKYQSVYQVRKFPAKIIRFLEIILPGKPGNMMFGLEKIK